MNMRTLVRSIAAVAIMGAASLVGASNSIAPTFSLPARSGGTVSLDQFKGQVVMINFWASWCGPCRQEMPLLDQIYKRYSPLGFTLIGVNVETDSKDAEKVLSQLPVSFPVLFDRENKVSSLYAVSAMPSTVFIDRQGNVRVLHKGYKAGDENEYINQIRALVKE